MSVLHHLGVFAQSITLPPDQQPASGSLWKAIMDKIDVMAIASGAWWIALHVVLPVLLILGVGGYIIASLFGNTMMVRKFRGGIFSIATGSIMAVLALVVANFALSR